MLRRLLVTTLALISFFVLPVLPDSAAKPAPPTSATTTVELVASCSFRVTYSWVGFSGSGLVAELALGYRETGGANAFLAWTFVPSQAGTSGTVSKTFTLTGTPTWHDYLGFGELFKTSNKAASGLSAVRGSAASSSYLAPQECGSDVVVS